MQNVIELVIHDDGEFQIVMNALDSERFDFMVTTKSGESCFEHSDGSPQHFDTVVEAVEAYNIVVDEERR